MMKHQQQQKASTQYNIWSYFTGAYYMHMAHEKG